MKKIDQLRLVAQCALADNRQAFGQLVEAYQPQLRRFLMNLTEGDEMLTDDLAQETFLKAYVNIRNFKGLADFSTWLYRIAYNEFYNYHRSRHNEQLLDEGTQLPDMSVSSDAAVEACMTVGSAMAALGDTERAVVSLFFIEDLPLKKIAAIMGMPENTVKSHLRRGKENLKKMIKTPY